jgi:hypothetical protein
MAITYLPDRQSHSDLAMSQCVRCPSDGDVHLVTVRLAAHTFVVREVMCQEARRLCRNNCLCVSDLQDRFKAA